MSETQWTQQEAIELCREIEKYCPKFGCHVALTGGLLYKASPRKDCDILFYRIRQVAKIDIDGLFSELEDRIGFAYVSGLGWCQKATWKEKSIDCFFPEGEGEDYGQPKDESEDQPFQNPTKIVMDSPHPSP